MAITVTITGTSIGTDTGPFSIYHTAVDPANLLASGITRTQMATPFNLTAPDGANSFHIVSSGICQNTGTASLTIPTPAPTAAPTAAPVTPAPVTPAPVTPSPVTPSPVTPEPTTPSPVTPSPVTPSPVTPSPVTPEPTTPSPVTPEPTTPSPVTPSPVTPSPVTPSPVTPSPTYAPPVSNPVTPAPVTTPAPVVTYNYYEVELCTTSEIITVRTEGAMSIGGVYDLDTAGTCGTVLGTTGGPGYSYSGPFEPIGGGGCLNAQCDAPTPAPATPAPAVTIYDVYEVCAGPNWGTHYYSVSGVFGSKGFVNSDISMCSSRIEIGMNYETMLSTYPGIEQMTSFTNNNCGCE
jgi:hypothetical protein